MDKKIYAIIDGYYEEGYSLLLINNPDGYKDEDVVFTYIDGEAPIPTSYFEMSDLLEDWTPYNGKFIVGGEYGDLDNETGEFKQNDDSFDLFYLVVTYENGKKISEVYEEG